MYGRVLATWEKALRATGKTCVAPSTVRGGSTGLVPCCMLVPGASGILIGTAELMGSLGGWLAKPCCSTNSSAFCASGRA